ncbi:metalloregulator ArsR/SmtB family transcription factor [Patescibacteria group bacterium]|nr:metalloregulator ArsR/SmtB family transcription factor [Patescibacteria group bacterium]MBU1123367.1 metalloregulator ArsR/SmtB family transcription factor [Patescibacteria group bacterium]MBU1911659.1 metalloregulator ArsR/SmtB family transcription factor [Patescibacteria group bacterium]
MNQIKSVAKQYKALGYPKRLMIILHLNKNDNESVGDIAKVIGLSERSTSKHLRQLEEAGLLIAKRRGVFMIYRLPLKKPTLLQSALKNI